MSRLVAGTAVAGAAGLAYATLVEPRWFALRHATVPVLRDPAARPMRVLHLSDLHLLPWQKASRRFVLRCLDAGPDAVVATGDIVGHPHAIPQAVDLLAEVARGRPAIAVLGSNDRFGPTLKNPARYLYSSEARSFGVRLDTPALVDGLADAGWHVLCNRRLTLDTPAGPVDVAGLDDPHIGLSRPDRVDWPRPADAAAADEVGGGRRGEAAVLRLGVVHAPYLAPLEAFAGHGYDLVLAGHTHGGQLRVPGYGALVDNCDLPLRQARGLSWHPPASRCGGEAGARDGTRRSQPGLGLHVSAGLGASMYAPFRFACRPEATILDLVGAPGAG